MSREEYINRLEQMFGQAMGDARYLEALEILERIRVAE